MTLGIVGPEAEKWTATGEESARNIIRAYLATGKYDRVTSGACHKGGVDIWAVEESAKRGVIVREFPAKEHSWYWFKKRNQQIARLADEVICITPERTVSGDVGWCKHCREKHVSSGGCWTVQYAAKIGRKTEVVVITV